MIGPPMCESVQRKQQGGRKNERVLGEEASMIKKEEKGCENLTQSVLEGRKRL